MKNKIFALLFTLVGLCAFAQSSVRENFLRELNAKSAHVQTIESNFVQVKHNSMLAQDVRSAGLFRFKHPAHLALVYDDPKGDCVVMGAEDFMIQAGGTRKVVKIASNPLYQQLQHVFAACFSGDVTALSSEGVFRCEERGGQYTVRINPDSKRARRYIAEIVLVFSRVDMLLDELRIVEVSGNYTSYYFKNRKTNVRLDDAVFACKR